MKKMKVRVMTMVLMAILIVTIIPINVFATETNNQIVKTKDQDYIIYVKELAKTEFKFAIANKAGASDSELNYINSVTDGAGNQVALITANKYESIIKNNEKNYLYIKAKNEDFCTEINFKEAFEQQKIEDIEKTTKKIKTEVKEDIIEQDEVVDGVKVKVTVGGLKITENENATYYYAITKLPADKYSKLMELAEKINSEYKNMDMYKKIETAKEFYNIYSQLSLEQNWNEVKDMTIRQPKDAKKDEKYIVYLKEINKDGTETIDIKLMTSFIKEDEGIEKIGTETKTVKETTKLPITGDSFILFIILAVIVLAAIIVFIRMKQIQNKKVEK